MKGETFFSSEDLAAYLRCPTREAARKWARRHKLRPAVRRGRILLYLRDDVDRLLAGFVMKPFPLKKTG